MNQSMSKRYVEETVKYLECHYRKVKISDTAKYIGINRSYLSGIFKREMGMSPQKYLLDYRMKRGCELLVETTLPITDVAHAIGYENPLTYSKTFKNIFGVSPSFYRRMNTIYR